MWIAEMVERATIDQGRGLDILIEQKKISHEEDPDDDQDDPDLPKIPK